MSIQNLLTFTKFLNKFREVERVILNTGSDRNENDAEHSYQLAMLGWYFIQSKGFDLDVNKVIQYALVHDLVETYAGDTYFDSKDVSLKDSKQQRELEATDRIASEFPDFPDLADLIHAYEARGDREAKFVYALDKVIPVINIYLDNGRSWIRDGVTLAALRTKDEKVKVSPEVESIWFELVEMIEEMDWARAA